MSDRRYYTVKEVADMFGVTGETIRNWIQDRQLMAIQPRGENGKYLIPVAAVEVYTQRQAGKVAPTLPSRVGEMFTVEPEQLYRERIEPVLAETGLTADELLRRLLTDSDLYLRYDSFAMDYSDYVDAVASLAQQQSHSNTLSAGA